MLHAYRLARKRKAASFRRWKRTGSRVAGRRRILESSEENDAELQTRFDIGWQHASLGAQTAAQADFLVI